MKVLLTAWALVDYAGIPLFTKDLAVALKAAGCEVAVYTLRPGAIAQAITARGIAVVTDLRRLPFRPDVIHGQDQPLLIKALRRFADAAAIAVTHDATSTIDAPFFHPRIHRYIAIDERCRQRIAAIPDIPPGRIGVVLNAVDLTRFQPRPPLPVTPGRALIFSNYAKRDSHMRPVMEACAEAGLAVDVVGSGVGKAVARPEEILGDYDIVFAKARCALEALATGTAVVLCDFAGLGPMVTANNVLALRRMNFGAGVLTQPLSAAAIGREILRYDAGDAARVSQIIRDVAGLDQAAGQWLALYREAVQDAARGRGDDAALATLERKWWTFYRLVPLASGIRKVRNLPLVGGTLYALAARLRHMRY